MALHRSTLRSQLEPAGVDIVLAEYADHPLGVDVAVGVEQDVGIATPSDIADLPGSPERA
jgi:hypothetical protein